MKTLKEVLKDIKDLQDHHKDLGLTGTTTQSVKDGKKVSIYRKAATYLELKPDKESIVSQQSLLKKRLKIISDGYSEWCKNTPESADMIRNGKNPKTKYDAIMETKKWKQELAFINYILS